MVLSRFSPARLFRKSQFYNERTQKVLSRLNTGLALTSMWISRSTVVRLPRGAILSSCGTSMKTRRPTRDSLRRPVTFTSACMLPKDREPSTVVTDRRPSTSVRLPFPYGKMRIASLDPHFSVLLTSSEISPRRETKDRKPSTDRRFMLFYQTRRMLGENSSDLGTYRDNKAVQGQNIRESINRH